MFKLLPLTKRWSQHFILQMIHDEIMIYSSQLLCQSQTNQSN